MPDSIVYTDGRRGYNALDVSDFHFFWINHSELFVERHNHINGIENFWNRAKRYMRALSEARKWFWTANLMVYQSPFWVVFTQRHCVRVFDLAF
ncbi:MAG: transposase [Robiginitomaculum sp.]|nr:transposase [Robiginitomaculum sp.]